MARGGIGRMIVSWSPMGGDQNARAALAAKGSGAIMASLDTLAMTGTELSIEQMEEVDGGLVGLAVAVIFFGIGYAIGKNI